MSDTTSNIKKESEKRPCECEHEYDFEVFEQFNNFPYSSGCTEVCIKEEKAAMDVLMKHLKAISLINQSVKVNKDGTIPEYSFNDVFNYYSGDENLENKNIQELFNINLLDLDIPRLKKRTDIPKDRRGSTHEKEDENLNK